MLISHQELQGEEILYTQNKLSVHLLHYSTKLRNNFLYKVSILLLTVQLDVMDIILKIYDNCITNLLFKGGGYVYKTGVENVVHCTVINYKQCSSDFIVAEPYTIALNLTLYSIAESVLY